MFDLFVKENWQFSASSNNFWTKGPLKLTILVAFLWLLQTVREIDYMSACNVSNLRWDLSVERRHTESASFAGRHSQLLDRVSGARGLVVARGGLLLLLMWPGVLMVEDSPAQQQRHTAGLVCHTFTTCHRRILILRFTMGVNIALLLTRGTH